MASGGRTTLDEVLSLAERLPPKDKLRLIERLAPQISAALSDLDTPDDDAWQELLALAGETRDLPGLTIDSADLLSSMRR